MVVAAIALLPGIGGLRPRFAHASPGWVVCGAVLELPSVLLRARFPARVLRSHELVCELQDRDGRAGDWRGAAGWRRRRPGPWRVGAPPRRDAQRADRTLAFFLLTSLPNVGLLIVLGLALTVELVPGPVGVALTLVPATVAAGSVIGTLALGRVDGVPATAAVLLYRAIQLWIRPAWERSPSYSCARCCAAERARSACAPRGGAVEILGHGRCAIARPIRAPSATSTRRPQDQMPVADRPRYQTAQRGRSRMIAAATRALRNATNRRTAPSRSGRDDPKTP